MENSFHKANYADLLEQVKLATTYNERTLADHNAAMYAVEYHKEIFGKEMEEWEMQ